MVNRVPPREGISVTYRPARTNARSVDSQSWTYNHQIRSAGGPSWNSSMSGQPRGPRPVAWAGTLTFQRRPTSNTAGVPRWAGICFFNFLTNTELAPSQREPSSRTKRLYQSFFPYPFSPVLTTADGFCFELEPARFPEVLKGKQPAGPNAGFRPTCETGRRAQL